MNKTILLLFLAVCILGMALILLNQRLGREQEARAPIRSNQPVVSDAPLTGPVPEYTVPAPPPAPLAKEAGQPAPSPVQQAIERETASERDAAAAAAAALAVEQKEANAALHSSPVQAANPPAPTTSHPNATAPATPTPPKASAEAPARQGVNAPARTPERTPERAAQAPKKPASQEKTAGPQTITRFVVFARDSGATVRLSGNGPLRYKSMNLENPDRVVLDLEGRWDVKAPAVPKNPLVNAVRVGEMDGRTRIVIDLKAKPRSAKVSPSKAGDGVDVRVDK